MVWREKNDETNNLNIKKIKVNLNFKIELGNQAS